MIFERESLSIGFWIVVSVFIVSIILGLLGIIVEYTSLGNLSLSHEETNFSNINIPII